MDIQTGLWIFGVVLEIALLALFVYRRIWKTIPFFGVYLAWGILIDLGSYLATHHSHYNYLKLYTAEIFIDTALQFCVLVEITASVFRPTGSGVSMRAIVILSAFIFGLGSLIWPFTHIQGLNSQYVLVLISAHLQQTVSILRIAVFLILASGSQWLAISWRNRELQVATGLGFYSLVSVAVSIAQTRQVHWSKYILLGEIVTASYFISLLYWIVSFARPEAERKTMSPAAQRALEAISGHARASREMAISRSHKGSE